MTPAEVAQVQEHRDECLSKLHSAVANYLSTPDLVYLDDSGFPSWQKLTGNYYLAGETYIGHRDTGTYTVGLLAHFTQHAWKRDDGSLVENVDYLASRDSTPASPPQSDLRARTPTTSHETQLKEFIKLSKAEFPEHFAK